MTLAGQRRLARAPRRCSASMGVVRPEVQKVLDKLADVPVDIDPRFVTAEKLLKQY